MSAYFGYDDSKTSMGDTSRHTFKIKSTYWYLGDVCRHTLDIMTQRHPWVIQVDILSKLRVHMYLGDVCQHTFDVAIQRHSWVIQVDILSKLFGIWVCRRRRKVKLGQCASEDLKCFLAATRDTGNTCLLDQFCCLL